MKMKLFFPFLALAFLTLFAACNTSVNADQVLQNEDLRQQLFEKIAGDHNLMMDFMQLAMKNEHAKSMMMEQGGMQGGMMNAQKVMQMMQQKPEMMHGMMSEMMKDGKMMGHMMQMMHQEGMMSEECMKSCMQMMKEKGMDMGMGEMQQDGMMESEDGHGHQH